MIWPLLSTILALGLPLAGVLLAGHPLAAYTEFPPLTRYVEHAGFSRIAFSLMAVSLVWILGPFVLRGLRPSQSAIPDRQSAIPFPLWGWLSLLSGVAFWILAWKRFAWFAPLQQFTFSPLWFSYIGVVNALTWKRTGRCMMLSEPRKFLILFAVSAIFWWYFEYLNRFVQNWYYVGVDGLTPLKYFVFATLPFSTVLPAVMGTAELLESFPGLGLAWESFPPRRWNHPRLVAGITLGVAAFALAAIGVWPDYLFPFLWIAPLAIITAIETLAGRSTIFSPTAGGRWRRIGLLALAALICGVFWEMWNYYSAAKWIYAVPFVQKFHLFEMPLLGFAGYLPFGLECAVIAGLVASPPRRMESN
jgi:hypothetical protein